MALSKARKAELARMTLPTDQETTKRVNAFIQLSGMTQSDLCDAVGYAGSSLRLFLKGTYDLHHATASNTAAIRAALKEFLDLQESAHMEERAAPAHRTKDFMDVRRACLAALERGSAYIIDGPPGTQKTFSLRAAEREINARNDGSRALYVYARVDHAPQSFLQECCKIAQIFSHGNIDQLIRKLRYFLGRGRILLIVDEAQHLDHKGLEVLRQLLDLPPHFGVILAGSHDLTQRLSHWQMEQWRSRVRRTLALNGPSVEESRGIIRAELEPLLGKQTDAQCAGILEGCQATASRMHTLGGKLVAKRFSYISARDLFFTIEGIQQQVRLRKEGAV
jgi:DNA transposition AAA+ family ATPase